MIKVKYTGENVDTAIDDGSGTTTLVDFFQSRRQVSQSLRMG